MTGGKEVEERERKRKAEMITKKKADDELAYPT